MLGIFFGNFQPGFEKPSAFVRVGRCQNPAKSWLLRFQSQGIVVAFTTELRWQKAFRITHSTRRLQLGPFVGLKQPSKPRLGRVDAQRVGRVLASKLRS